MESTAMLSEQVAEVVKLDIAIEKLESDLKAIKQSRDELINVNIPNTLDFLGVASIILVDGTACKIETLTNCKILDREKFFEYLAFSGQEAIIKQAEPTIHPQTLKAWARQADDIPEGLVEITQFRRAKIG